MSTDLHPDFVDTLNKVKQGVAVNFPMPDGTMLVKKVGVNRYRVTISDSKRADTVTDLKYTGLVNLFKKFTSRAITKGTY